MSLVLAVASLLLPQIFTNALEVFGVSLLCWRPLLCRPHAWLLAPDCLSGFERLLVTAYFPAVQVDAICILTSATSTAIGN